MKSTFAHLKARMAVSLYNGVAFCARPALWPYLSIRTMRGKEDKIRRRERYGHPSCVRPEGPLIWLHAASVGETVALIPLIDHIMRLGIHVLLTTGTTTSANLVENRFGNRIIHQYAPLDIKKYTSRFIDYWQPNLSLTCESEVWPTRILELSKRKIPQIWANAHLSDKSFKSWKKRPALSRYLFSKIDVAICQTETDAAHYRDLGVRSVAISGNLKADVPPMVDRSVLDTYRNSIGKRPIWAAISTHEGEETIAVNVHRALKKHIPNLMTIIVPRHPERMSDILKKIPQKDDLNIICRSSDALPDAQTDIFFGDTIGEIGLFLRLAKVAFVGKSLSEKGGHNPLEPALIGSAILTGPHVENFQQTYNKLVEAKGACIVTDPTQLAVQISTLLTKPDMRRSMVKAAYETAISLSGALERTRHVLYPFLQPLAVEARLVQEWDISDDV